jgi:hypothetical protein
MNALPGTMMVDLSAPDRDRAAAVWALSHMVATRYHPRHPEHASLLGRQLAFTAWHGSDRATQRGCQEQGVCGLYGIGCRLVEQVISGLQRSDEPHRVERFSQVSGVEPDALLEIPPSALLALTLQHDLLAAGLAAEAYRAGGPLPSSDSPERCAQTWVSRLLTARGPERQRHQAAWAQGFTASARDMLELLA